MKLADYVVDVLTKNGVNHVFEFIGGAIVHLLDSISKRDDISCISVRHEQSGSFAAEAYARINGTLGAAMATSGPGALNLVTGIGSCYFDSVPCLFITGQVNTYEYKFEQAVRQVGFQETDIVSVVTPITKYAKLVTEPKMIRYELEKAIYLAQHGRPGPVLLDIPMNLQRAQIEPDDLVSFFCSDEYFELNTNGIENSDICSQLQQMINESSRPLILAGGGIRIANAIEYFNIFVERTGIPVVTSLMGIDVLPHNHPSNFGLIGSYGNRYSNLAVANCDLLIVLGSRLDSRQTGTRPDTFARAAKIVHVDIDFQEFNAKVEADLIIHSDIKRFLQKMNIIDLGMRTYQEWYSILQNYRIKFPTYSEDESINFIEPNRFIEKLSSYADSRDTICLDVGQHQMWASQSFQIKAGQRLLNSGGMGAMGFALPAAIGACFAHNRQRVLVIAGDGGIQVNIQELDTIARNKLPIIIFVLNNNSLGMVRQFQDLYFDGRQQSTVLGNPDFVKIALAYQIPGYQIRNNSEIDSVLTEVFMTKGPVLVEVALPQNTLVNPKLVVNRPVEDMYPFLDRDELKELMLIDLVEEMEVPR